MAEVPAAWSEVASGLGKAATVTLNGLGQGTIEFITDSANQRWEVGSVVVSTNQPATATVIPVVNLGLNASQFASLTLTGQRGATWSGNQDTWSGGTVDVSPTDSFAVVFAPPPGTSGSPLAGVIASAVVTGTKYTRRA